MQSAKIKNQSRHLQLIPWLTYNALRSRACAFPAMKLPRAGMLGMFGIKKAITIIIIIITL